MLRQYLLKYPSSNVTDRYSASSTMKSRKRAGKRLLYMMSSKHSLLKHVMKYNLHHELRALVQSNQSWSLPFEGSECEHGPKSSDYCGWRTAQWWEAVSSSTLVVIFLSTCILTPSTPSYSSWIRTLIFSLKSLYEYLIVHYFIVYDLHYVRTDSFQYGSARPGTFENSRFHITGRQYKVGLLTSSTQQWILLWGYYSERYFCG